MKKFILGISTVVLFSCHALDDNDYQQAEQFLTVNLPVHHTLTTKLINGLGQEEYFSPYDYTNLYEALSVLDSLKQRCAYVKRIVKDTVIISDEFLHKHITYSLHTWRTSPFCRHVNVREFHEFILPYRAGVETFSEYRDTIIRRYAFVCDSIRRKVDPVMAATVINNELKTWLKFDLRSHACLKEPSILAILHQKRGSCRSLTQFTAQVMRTMGIPVAIDECPVWGHRNSGHQWNAVLDTTGHWIPFGGAETNPDEFDAVNDSVKAPKIYRHTFSEQKEFYSFGDGSHHLPPVFRNSYRQDVTSKYVSTSQVTISLDHDNSKLKRILYLAVFNAEKWRVVAGTEIKNGKAVFNQVGNNNIVYLPVFYNEGKVVPAGDPFVLSGNKQKNIGIKTSVLSNYKLEYYNKFFDIKWNIGIPRPGWRMELFYWDNKWISCGICTVGKDQRLHFTNVPEGAVFFIRSHDWTNEWQRIFTIDDNNQEWY